jgi:Tfp pilus assembly protein PilX
MENRERILTPAAARDQAGFTMVIILGLLMVLTVMGSVALYSVRGEVGHTGRDSNHSRAQLVAESALNWAISALQKEKGNVLAFSAATHASNGSDPLPDFLQNGTTNNRKLHSWDLTPIYPGSVKQDQEGWITQETLDNKVSLTGSGEESIAFKVWFPNDSTIRVSGRGMVNGVSAEVEMTGNMQYSDAELH